MGFLMILIRINIVLLSLLLTIKICCGVSIADLEQVHAGWRQPNKTLLLSAFPVGEFYSKLIKEHSRTLFCCLYCWVWTVICPIVLEANSILSSNNISEYKWIQKIYFHISLYIIETLLGLTTKNLENLFGFSWSSSFFVGKNLFRST